jgi:hypothetical protein
MLIRDKSMTNCVKQTGILIIKTTVVLPNNNNTIIKVQIRDPHTLHPHRMGTTIKVRRPRKTSTSNIRVMKRAKRKLKTFSKIIGKISGMAQA